MIEAYGPALLQAIAQFGSGQKACEVSIVGHYAAPHKVILARHVGRFPALMCNLNIIIGNGALFALMRPESL